MKSFKALLEETLNQRHIVDNRQVVSVTDITESVLIAFHQACLDVLNMHNWVWNLREISYVTSASNDSYPMPYGIVKGLYITDSDGNKCTLDYVNELDATKGCPTQWTHDWVNEEIAIAPAESDALHTMTIKYYDKHIAYHTDRSVLSNLMTDFDDAGTSVATTLQYLNVPEAIYDVYARCIITLTRVYLNEGSQPSVLADQKAEFNAAKLSLEEYAKTPFYDAQRFEI